MHKEQNLQNKMDPPIHCYSIEFHLLEVKFLLAMEASTESI